MNHIFLVRHGENPANITKEFSYRKVDYSLTEKGRLQSIQTALYFENLGIDEIFSSPLKRAIETAEEISKKVNKKITIIEEFREVNVGDLEGKPADEKSWGIYSDVFREWMSGNHYYNFPGGENWDNLSKRFIEGLKIVTKGKDNKKIVIVGHGGIFTFGAVDLFKKINLNDIISKENHNCSVSQLLVDGNDLGLTAELINWADVSHLTGEASKFIEAIPDNAKIRVPETIWSTF